MMLECFTWIPHLLCSLISPEKGFGPLPDDLLIDILSRLPADSVLQYCRRVCKHWRALTSSSYFVALQNRRAPSLILVQCCHEWCTFDPKLHLSVFDEHAKKLKRIHLKSEITIMREHNPVLIGSCGTLLIFRAYPEGRYCYDFVLNLITQEQHVITTIGGYVCGLYFYPLASEFKFLWVHVLSDCNYLYYIYSSTSHVIREIASSRFCFRPAFRTFPTIVNLALHWIVAPTSIKIDDVDPCMHAIMVFRIDSEKLYTLPHPIIDQCDYRRSHYMMHLFVKDDYLSLCHYRDCDGNVDIWILEDFANWNWVRRYSVNISSVSRYKIDTVMRRYSRNPGLCWERMKVLSVSKDEVLIEWFSELYLIDLVRSSVQKIDLHHKNSNEWLWDTCTSVAYTSSLATPSLVSPMGNVLSIGGSVMRRSRRRAWVQNVWKY